ncbi:MAG: hypothetical protein U9R64_01190, partial [Pseudomonadota bacterium]|nr:hypothetical protein [Pseudomonadota bacterium]
MASVSLTDDGLRAVKRALVSRFPDDKSSHLTEALAAACGFRTHASLLAAVRDTDPQDPNFVLLDEAAFLARRADLRGEPCAREDEHMLFDWLGLEHGTHVLKTTSTKYHVNGHRRFRKSGHLKFPSLAGGFVSVISRDGDRAFPLLAGGRA